ncbi:MAG: hypothetical protein L0287_22665 [Anaerolineae bacterium]|nr:hypothetical protein [Anaerolineae bacterium]
MNDLLFSNPLKKGMQAILALTILLFSLGPGGTRVVHASPPVNDTRASATVINSLIFTPPPFSTTEATPPYLPPPAPPPTEPADPDNISCEGNALNAGYASVWYTYTPAINESISLDTLDSNYDTFIAVWTVTSGNLSLVICDDDTFENQQSELFFTGSAGTTYYIEVAQFSYYEGEPDPPAPPNPPGGTLDFNAYITTTNVAIHGTIMGKYYIPPGGSLRRGFADVDNGPANITSTNGANIIAALRAIWKEPGLRFSYSEMMGMPKEQLSTEYWFPWYNNLDKPSMDQGFRVANLDTTSHTIQISLGSTPLDSFNLSGGASTRVNYDVNNGPIRISCTSCNPANSNDRIIAAIRVIWQEPGFRSSYSEMMGLPKERLSTEYWFPWYNNINTVSMNQGFRIANVSTTETNTIEVRLGNNITPLATITLGPGASTRVDYPVDNGPIRIVCTTCTNTNYDQIITALRVIWQEPGPGIRSSYSEMMGLPKELLSTEYWFPWYNNLSTIAMDQGFRIANVDTTAHTIQVFVGGTQVGTNINLAGGASIRVNYDVNNGPIRIVCATCINPDDKIISALRVIWQEPGYRTSYSEMMGLPKELLSTEYWFPWYNNAFPATMDQGFRFGVP